MGMIEHDPRDKDERGQQRHQQQHESELGQRVQRHRRRRRRIDAQPLQCHRTERTTWKEGRRRFIARYSCSATGSAVHCFSDPYSPLSGTVNPATAVLLPLRLYNPVMPVCFYIKMFAVS